MDPSLLDLIKKYKLKEYIEKFVTEGVTNYAHIRDIDNDSQRSHYHMNAADRRSFNKMRDECIYLCSSKTVSRKPSSCAFLDSDLETPPAVSLSTSIQSGDADDRSQGLCQGLQGISIAEDSDICDYESGDPVGQMKMKQGIPHISMFNPTPFPRYDLTPVNGYRGLGLIIVNANFEDQKHFRKGADKDKEMLEVLFNKMKLRNEILKDFKKEKCLESIKEHIDKALSDEIVKIIVIAISSHGEYGDKFACTDGVIQIQKIIDILKIPGLIGIPKVLIIQACRGEKSDPVEDNISQTAEFYPPSTKESDILIAYSSVHGYVANRDPEEGSWFIQSLLEAYNQGHTHGHELADFQQILTCTNNLMLTEKVCEKSGVICKQPSQTVSTLNKLIYL